MDRVEALWTHPTATRLRRFGIVGAFTSGVQTGLLWVFVEYLGMWYVIAAVIAIEITIILTFVINNSWTFRPSRHQTLRSYGRGLVKTNIVRGTAIPLQTGILYALVTWAGVMYLIANLGAILLTGLYRYYLDSRWTWRIVDSS